MKIARLSFIGYCVASLLLASCQSTTDLSSGSTKDGEKIVSIIGRQSKSSLDDLSGTLASSEEAITPTPEQASETQEAATTVPTPLPPATATPKPTVTPAPTAIPSSEVTVSYAEIFPGGSDLSRNRPVDFAIKTDFGSTVGTMLLLSGFFIYEGQDIPAESTCGQIPEGSRSRLTWMPEPSLFGPGDHSFNDWGHILAESIPADATHFIAMFTISRQSDAALEYCLQKTYILTDEPAVAPPPDDPSAIKVMGVAFWPDTAAVDRSSSFDFGARLDFESINMTQVRLLIFFTYQGQELPGESTCMSEQVPGQSGGTRWNTGNAIRMWTGINHFERTYAFSAEDPGDATHLVMWLLLEGMSGQPILCWQKIIELLPAN